MKSVYNNIGVNCLITFFIYFSIYHLSYNVFHEYLFLWTAANKYCYIWILSYLFLIFNKVIFSYCVTFGNIIGIFIGQYLGDYIQEIRMNKIISSSTVEERWYLSLHYGVAIWIITILLSFLVGLLLYKKQKKHLSLKTRL